MSISYEPWQSLHATSPDGSQDWGDVSVQFTNGSNAPYWYCFSYSLGTRYQQAESPLELVLQRLVLVKLVVAVDDLFGIAVMGTT